MSGSQDRALLQAEMASSFPFPPSPSVRNVSKLAGEIEAKTPQMSQNLIIVNLSQKPTSSFPNKEKTANLSRRPSPQRFPQTCLSTLAAHLPLQFPFHEAHQKVWRAPWAGNVYAPIVTPSSPSASKTTQNPLQARNSPEK